MNWIAQHWDALLKISGGVIVVTTFCKGVYEYVKQRADKRAQQFLELRKSFRENTAFQKIAHRMTDDSDFSGIKDNDKYEYMAFFEDIAFLMNSGLIRKEVAFYMFGYDAITAWENDEFWDKELREDIYWSLLADFVDQMRETGKTFKYDRKKLRI